MLSLRVGANFRVMPIPMVPAFTNTSKDLEGQGGGSGTIVRTQPWYPLLLQLLIEILVISPTQQEFIMPAGVPQLVVWPLSGISGDQEVFQKKLQDFWHPPGGARQNQLSIQTVG